MDNKQYVNIIGQETPIKLMPKSELRNVYVDVLLGFNFYEALFGGERLILLKPKQTRPYTPTMLLAMSKRIGIILNAPIVFWYDNLTTTQRDRFIAKGIYFLVPKKYAFFPFLVIGRLTTDTKISKKISPAAQYLLFYHMQKTSLEGLDASKIAELIPYSYVTVTKALKELTKFGLCEMRTLINRMKTAHFMGNKRELWIKSLPVLSNPIKEKLYCDVLDNTDGLIQSGINALSHYTSLNREPMQTYALTREDLECLKGNIKGLNRVDGSVCLEIWRYYPIPLTQDFVDPLSLYISLMDDKDPRVENELEIMINSLW